MKYRISLYIDQARQERVRGTPLEARLKPIFGGEIKVLEVEVDEDLAHAVLSAFPSARVDARGYIEDLPAAFRKALFEAVVATGDPGRTALEKVLQQIEEIKKQAERETEYLPPP